MSSLQRVLEPEVMDSAAEAADYDQMDHSAVNQAFAADFLAVWHGRSPILDVGTGTAQIPIEICKRDKNARILAIDMAQEMLHVGRRNVVQHGLADRIQLDCRDAKQTQYGSRAYEAVISNSIIHHIPNPEAVFAEMLRLTAPGGLIFVRDLARPADEATLRQLVATYAGNANTHQQSMFAESLAAALTVEEVRAILTRHGCSPKEVNQTSDRHWTWIHFASH